MLAMFSLNVMFLIDLSVNHQNLQGITPQITGPQITMCIDYPLPLIPRVCMLGVERWWGAEDEREERRVSQGGGEKTLRRFLSLRVESSHERAAVYSGDDPVSIPIYIYN